MKGLVRFGCIFGVVAFRSYLEKQGIILGGIPTAILFAVAATVAVKLGKKADAKK